MIVLTKMHHICSKFKQNVKELKEFRKIKVKKVVMAEYIVRRSKRYFMSLGNNPAQRLKNDIR